MGIFSRTNASFVSLFFLAAGTHAFADDRPLIWSPVKNSNTSYAVKLGLRLPSELAPEAGINLGLDASDRGAVVGTPVRLWGKITTSTIQTPAYQLKRDVRINLDAVTGNGLAGINMSEKRIATEALDIETSRQYGIRYDGLAADWKGEASQSIRVSRVASGTAVILRAKALDTFKELGAGISVEQKISERLSLNGSIEQTTAATTPTSNISARYTFKW